MGGTSDWTEKVEVVTSQLTEEDECTAAELALGLLEGAELRSAEMRVRHDPRFRAEYDRWTEHFATLLESSFAQPPPRARRRLARRLPPVNSGLGLRQAVARLTEVLTPGEIAVIFGLKIVVLVSIILSLL